MHAMYRPTASDASVMMPVLPTGSVFLGLKELLQPYLVSVVATSRRDFGCSHGQRLAYNGAPKSGQRSKRHSVLQK